FTQFADTVDYLVAQLHERGIARVAAATGDSENPTKLAWRFSPESNEKRQEVPPDQELQVLVATDILSEGQNLQDATCLFLVAVWNSLVLDYPIRFRVSANVNYFYVYQLPVP